MKTLDLRPRCARSVCHKLIRTSQMAQANWKRYAPFCSYHCQEWNRIEAVRAYLDSLPEIRS